MQTKTVKLKTTAGAGVFIAHPRTAAGYRRASRTFIVAVERVPHHITAAEVAATYTRTAVDVPCDGPYALWWADLARARPGHIVRPPARPAAQRLIAAGGSERGIQSIPRRRS